MVFEDSCFKNYLVPCAKNSWTCCVESGLNGICGVKKEVFVEFKNSVL